MPNMYVWWLTQGPGTHNPSTVQPSKSTAPAYSIGSVTHRVQESHPMSKGKGQWGTPGPGCYDHAKHTMAQASREWVEKSARLSTDVRIRRVEKRC